MTLTDTKLQKRDGKNCCNEPRTTKTIPVLVLETMFTQGNELMSRKNHFIPISMMAIIIGRLLL